jgi:hypothetical protein
MTRRPFTYTPLATAVQTASLLLVAACAACGQLAREGFWLRSLFWPPRYRGREKHQDLRTGR